jgi:hypothetical protein
VNEKNIVFLQAKNYTSAAISLDNFLEKLEIGTVVYPSIAFFCFWMSLICRHGNQKFLQMKYYPKQIGRISQWAGGEDGSSGIGRKVNGESFLTLPADLHGLPRLASSRSYGLKTKLYIGSISRIEKIQDPNFYGTIKKLLKKYPFIEYLATGRPGDEKKIPRDILSTGQVTFVGWVEPTIFLGDLDIYIDPWPFGGGDMSYLAMVNGVPFITMQTELGQNAGPLSFIKHIAASSRDARKLMNCLPCDEVQFFDVFESLVSSELKRAAIGRAWASACEVMSTLNDSRWRSFMFE